MYAEHEIISKAENVIDALDFSWEADAGKYEATVKSLVQFFREYADGFHHRKEEEVLFPAIRNHPDFAIPGMIDALLHHHDEFREYARDILAALEQSDYPESYKLLTHYMQDLKDHIAAENDELFVLAENLLGPDQLEAIYFRFQDIDHALGESRKNELIHMLAALEEQESEKV